MDELEREIDAALDSMRPRLVDKRAADDGGIGSNVELAAGVRGNVEWLQCTGGASVKDGVTTYACPHAAVPGTFPAVCRSHGAGLPVVRAAAAIRLEAARARIQETLESAVDEAIAAHLKVLRTSGPYLEGTERVVDKVSNTGKIVSVVEGVKVSAGDIMRAADRILALAGMSPELTALATAGQQVKMSTEEEDADAHDPRRVLQEMLLSAGDDKLARLAARLGAVPAQARDAAVNDIARLESQFTDDSSNEL